MTVILLYRSGDSFSSNAVLSLLVSSVMEILPFLDGSDELLLLVEVVDLAIVFRGLRCVGASNQKKII